MNHPIINIEQLLRAGVHLGNLATKWNPKMAPYIYGIRNKNHIIDLDKTVISLRRALDFLEQVTRQNGKVIFVGTDEISSQCARYYGKISNQHYLHKSWFGGLLTNWNHFKKFLADLRNKEDVIFDKKNPKLIKRHQRLLTILEGIKEMETLPAAIIVLNTTQHSIAIREANQMNIPVIALLDTDCNPDGITYPIPANNDSISSVKLISKLLSIAAGQLPYTADA